LKRSDIAGKTGTTNGPMDSWFSGYNPTVVTTTWVGFDNYTPLGRKEFGGTAALPIWIEFMSKALNNSPQIERSVPDGIVNVRIDPDTGRLAQSGQRDAIFEFFRQEHVPEQGDWADDQRNGGANADDLIRDIF
jgi:penicillin-binding protein 1A